MDTIHKIVYKEWSLFSVPRPFFGIPNTSYVYTIDALGSTCTLHVPNTHTRVYMRHT